MNKFVLPVTALTLLTFIAQPALAFEIGFDWGNIPSCTNGNPNTVSSPAFSISGLPVGTTQLKFKLTDLDVPSYNHGGGAIAFAGGKTVPAGAFRYQSPCPPNGTHTYQWTATALDASGKKLGTAKAKKNYP